ncbi:unannotated protein [freshwater metagenome]|uniref:Unannotated protein n=1 Tax=freshwater metagenome TaxID=449393 RepID=A0A6J6HN15_9ZZZZ
MEESDHRSSVVQEDLPGECAHEIGDKERKYDKGKEQVLVAAALRGDHVGERIADDDRRECGDTGVGERPDDHRRVVRKNLRVVGQATVLEREPTEAEQRENEEHRKPESARGEQQIRDEPPPRPHAGFVPVALATGTTNRSGRGDGCHRLREVRYCSVAAVKARVSSSASASGRTSNSYSGGVAGGLMNGLACAAGDMYFSAPVTGEP